MTIKRGAKLIFLDYSDITLIEDYDDCVKVHSISKTHVIRATLKEIEKVNYPVTSSNV